MPKITYSTTEYGQLRLNLDGEYTLMATAGLDQRAKTITPDSLYKGYRLERHLQAYDRPDVVALLLAN